MGQAFMAYERSAGRLPHRTGARYQSLQMRRPANDGTLYKDAVDAVYAADPSELHYEAPYSRLGSPAKWSWRATPDRTGLETTPLAPNVPPLGQSSSRLSGTSMWSTEKRMPFNAAPKMVRGRAHSYSVWMKAYPLDRLSVSEEDDVAVKQFCKEYGVASSVYEQMRGLANDVVEKHGVSPVKIRSEIACMDGDKVCILIMVVDEDVDTIADLNFEMAGKLASTDSIPTSLHAMFKAR